MKLSFSTLAFPDKTIDEIVNIALKNGYDGVELRGGEKEGHIHPGLNFREIQRIKNLFQGNKIEICCVTAYTRIGSKKEEERINDITKLKKYIELAEEINCPFVRTFGISENIDKKDFNFGIEQVIKSFEELNDYINKKNYKVKVLLETHDILCKSEDFFRIFNEFKGKNCGILWDVAHTIRAGDPIEKTLDSLFPWIMHIHIKDWLKLFNGQDHYVLLGAGVLNINELLLNLKKQQYSGSLSLEWEKPWYPNIEESEIAVFQYKWKMDSYLKKL